jgi:hypothetical protein
MLTAWISSALGALLSSDDYGSSVERAAQVQVLWPDLRRRWWLLLPGRAASGVDIDLGCIVDCDRVACRKAANLGDREVTPPWDRWGPLAASSALASARTSAGAPRGPRPVVHRSDAWPSVALGSRLAAARLRNRSVLVEAGDHDRRPPAIQADRMPRPAVMDSARQGSAFRCGSGPPKYPPTPVRPFRLPPSELYESARAVRRTLQPPQATMRNRSCIRIRVLPQ